MDTIPQAMPNMVRKVRSLCAHNVRNTSRMRSPKVMAYWFGRRCGVKVSQIPCPGEGYGNGKGLVRGKIGNSRRGRARTPRSRTGMDLGDRELSSPTVVRVTLAAPRPDWAPRRRLRCGESQSDPRGAGDRSG